MCSVRQPTYVAQKDTMLSFALLAGTNRASYCEFYEDTLCDCSWNPLLYVKGVRGCSNASVFVERRDPYLVDETKPRVKP